MDDEIFIRKKRERTWDTFCVCFDVKPSISKVDYPTQNHIFLTQNFYLTSHNIYIILLDAFKHIPPITSKLLQYISMLVCLWFYAYKNFFHSWKGKWTEKLKIDKIYFLAAMIFDNSFQGQFLLIYYWKICEVAFRYARMTFKLKWITDLNGN